MDPSSFTTVLLAEIGVIATLAAGVVWVVKALLKKSDVRDAQIEKALNSLTEAVERFRRLESNESATSSAIIADLKEIVATQERILEIQERILAEVKEVNGP